MEIEHTDDNDAGASHIDVAKALLLDVRREAAFKAAQTRLPGAEWRDPALVDSWAANLPVDREIVVYCVYGHEVSQSTATRLRAAGLNARYLRGGIDGWQAAGLPVEPIGATP
jgi:Fe-Mn family superoxide dismutase